ncbi:MAG TPA: hypothetical protein VJP89_21890 [Pyrinomonadaceae bacterium]|nr:hypothetical protein [Pyrinomonadaceae bacterium]
MGGVIDALRWSTIHQIAFADTQRCVDAVRAAARGQDGVARVDQFWARASIRAFFAGMEALTFEMRLGLRQAIEARLHTLPLDEIPLLADQMLELDATGTPKPRQRFIPIERNFRFLFPRFAAMFGSKVTLDVADAGWNDFTRTVKIRNRITHPKSPQDLTLDAEDVSAAMRAISWYSEVMTSLIKELESLLGEAAARVTAETETIRRNTQNRLK